MSAALAERADAPTVAERTAGRSWTWVALAAVYLVAVAYHALHSLGHRTPAVFTDELLFAKLAQSLAAGDSFSFRGEPFFFPAPVAVLLQAPAWLLADAERAYELAKAANAAVMAAAVFPAYWLARQVVGRPAALLAAIAAVVAPGLLYHSYLMTDAAGYPAFLLAVAVMTRALARPSRGWELAAVGAALLAVATRTQFVVLPLAYLVAVGLVGRATREGMRTSYRRHRLSCGALVGVGLLAALTGGAVLGLYLEATDLEYPPGEVLRWAALTAGILPFSVGWLVAPGAVLGMGLLLARPRSRADAGFAALVAVVAPLLLLEAALIAAGDADRVMERYVVGLVPLSFVAFLAYAERGAPGRIVYAGLGLALGGVALAYPLATQADFLFSFDSPTLSAYGELARRTTEGDAAALFAAAALLGSLLLAASRPRAHTGLALASAAAGTLMLLGIAAYAADRGMTRRTLATFAASPPDWLDESGLGASDYLALPGAQAHAGWNLETWNRDFRLPLRLGAADADVFRFPPAHIAADGRLTVDGGVRLARRLVVNDYGSALELDGRRLLSPRPGLTVWELPALPRVRSLAQGVFHDGWASARAEYRVWGRPAGGRYRVRLALPAGRPPRTVSLAVGRGRSRTVALRPGESVRVELPVGGTRVRPLSIRTDRVDFEGGGGPAPRLVAVRISELSYAAS